MIRTLSFLTALSILITLPFPVLAQGEDVDEDYIQALVDQALNCGDYDKCSEVCITITDLKPAELKVAIDALIEALRDDSKEVRNLAAWALGDIGPEAVPALLEALGDEEGWVWMGAVNALGYIGPDAVPALIEALSDEEEDVRKAAAEALLKISSDPEIIEMANKALDSGGSGD